MPHDAGEKAHVRPGLGAEGHSGRRCRPNRSVIIRIDPGSQSHHILYHFLMVGLHNTLNGQIRRGEQMTGSRLIAMTFLAFLVPSLGWPVESAATIDSDQAALVQGNNAFAIELYQHLKDQPGNLFFSPESISTALAMTYAGARGKTAAEMAKVLHFTLPPDKLHPAMGKLLAERNAPHDGYQLKEADALWGQQGCTFLPDFLKLTKDNYGAAFNQVNFADTETARQTINHWVAQQTNDKIINLIAQGILTPKTRLVLTDAIYFKGEWETQFDKKLTRDENFFLTPTQAIKVPMMHRTGTFRYLDGGAFQALAIPYKGKELSMVIFLPKQPDGLTAFEQTLTPDNLQQWLGHLNATSRVIVTLSRFKMTKPIRLREMLEALGIKQAFDGRNANFSEMASKDEMPKAGTLYIGAVVHDAFVAVDEKGTKAAAATGVGLDILAMTPLVPSPQSIIFRADHPFLFVIRDNGSNIILFMGRVARPG